jgi:GTP-binding protein
VCVQVKQIPGSRSEEDSIQVQARGELQLGLLVEGMRRSRFEMELSAPRVLLRRVHGQLQEPIEDVLCEVPNTAVGARRSPCP